VDVDIYIRILVNVDIHNTVFVNVDRGYVFAHNIIVLKSVLFNTRILDRWYDWIRLNNIGITNIHQYRYICDDIHK